MAEQDTQVAQGQDRSEGDTWVDIMKRDSREVPDFLIEESYEYRGSEPIPAERYTSEEFARLERERMWPYVWQFAAREEDLPEPGDYIVHEIAGRSWLVVRQEDGSVRAFYNSSGHRGMRMVDGTSSVASFHCPYHVWEWR